MTEEREIYQNSITEPDKTEPDKGEHAQPLTDKKTDPSKKYEYPPRVPRTRNFANMEKILFSYPGIALAIKNLETQIRQIDNELVKSGVANYSIGSGGSVSSGDIEILSGPEADTSRRIEKKTKIKDKINVLRARKEAIREAMLQTGDKGGRIVRVKYFENWEAKNPGGRIWKEMGMLWYTYHRELLNALEFVGRFIGEWLEPWELERDRAERERRRVERAEKEERKAGEEKEEEGAASKDEKQGNQ